MATQTMGARAAEFILSEANGSRSRENGTVASGQTLKAGEIVMLSGTNLVAHDGSLDTDGNVATDAVGIVIGAVDASGGAVSNVAYIARDAEVKDDFLTYPTESTAGGEKVAVVASLKALGIITR